MSYSYYSNGEVLKNYQKGILIVDNIVLFITGYKSSNFVVYKQ